MAIASNKFRYLFLAQRKSDMEFEMQQICQERVLLTNQSAALSKQYAQNIFQNDDTSGNLITLPGLPNYTNVDTTEEFEAALIAIQELDENCEVRLKMIEATYEAKKTEMESVKKILDKNIEKDYKTFMKA